MSFSPRKLYKKILRPAAAGGALPLGDHYNLEAHVTQVIHAYNIDTIIDVGANVGQFGTWMRKLGFKGDIHSFEPVRHTYDALSKCAANDDRWQAHNVALGSSAGQSEINVTESSDFSSLLAANEFGSERFKGI